MLVRMCVRGYRLWREVSIDFPRSAPLVLIGPNGSGKTTILEVLAFLADAASEGLPFAAYTRREGPSDFFRADSDELSISVVLDAAPGRPTEPDGGPVQYTLLLERRGAFLQIRQEEIFVYKNGLGTRPLSVADRHLNRCRVRNFRSGDWDEVSAGPDELLLTSVKQQVHYPTVRHVQEALAGLRVHTGFAVSPRWARDPREGEFSPRNSATIRPQPHLDNRGLDVITTLYTLQQQDPDRWEVLLRLAKAEFPNIKRLFFPADPGGARISLGWQDHRFQSTLTAGQMSEGMWTYLSLLAAILPQNPPGVVGFDEPDAHLHPSALRSLVSLLEQLAAKTTVVVTSHSTSMLDHLDDPTRSLRIASVTPDGAAIASLDPEATRAWLSAYDHPSALRERGLLDPVNRDGEVT